MSGYQIDVSKGEMRGEVSAQWAMRPADQRFTSLGELEAQVQKWKNESRVEEMMPGQITAVATDDDKGLMIRMQNDAVDLAVDASHFAFGQVATLAKAPASYLRTIPAPLAAANLNYGLLSATQKPHGAYVRSNGETLLRGVTSLKYGRIFDVDVVREVRKIAGTGDTRWKVPGTIDWGGAHGISYNPKVDITKENTTLFASDRDIFLFLVDDMNPIEVGKLANGQPDLMFRGFYAWNSEVGARTFGVATMYLRGVCQNRNLWGVEGFSETTFAHTKGAPDRFAIEAGPALQSYAEGSTTKLITGVAEAKAAIVSKTDEERVDFLMKFGFSKKQADRLIAIGEEEEGRKPESVWDHAQAITAAARSSEYQDKRVHMELTAGKMLDKVTG